MREKSSVLVCCPDVCTRFCAGYMCGFQGTIVRKTADVKWQIVTGQIYGPWPHKSVTIHGQSMHMFHIIQ